VGTTNTWTIGNLAGGTGGSIAVTVSVPLLANGVILTNTATVRDGGGRSASTSEDTTVASTLFSLDVVDDPDPSAVLNNVTLTINYGNLSGATQTGVVLHAAFDPRFVPASSTPLANTGTNDTWTLGSLAPGQTGQVVVRGSFAAGAVGALARTDAQIGNANGVAFASETTSLGDATGISRYTATLIRLNRHVWRTRAWLQVPEGFDAHDQPFSMSLIGPAGVEHIAPLSVPQLSPQRTGNYSFVGAVPGSGDCKVKVVVRPTNWRVVAKCTGSGILPPFSPTTSFQTVISFGQSTFSSSGAALREVRPGVRRYP
jgi:hypothetical protein